MFGDYFFVVKYSFYLNNFYLYFGIGIFVIAQTYIGLITFFLHSLGSKGNTVVLLIPQMHNAYKCSAI